MLDAEVGEDEQDAEPFDVYPENWNTVQVFRALQTQWDMKVGEHIVYTGLKYPSLPTAMVIAGAPRADRRLVYMGVQLMEAAALKVLNERKSDDG